MYTQLYIYIYIYTHISFRAKRAPQPGLHGDGDGLRRDEPGDKLIVVIIIPIDN